MSNVKQLQLSDILKAEISRHESADGFQQSLRRSTWGNYMTIEMDVPVSELSGAEPNRAYGQTERDLDREIESPIEVVYNTNPEAVEAYGEWTLVDGNHRVAQAIANGKKTVPALVGVLDESETGQDDLLENPSRIFKQVKK